MFDNNAVNTYATYWFVQLLIESDLVYCYTMNLHFCKEKVRLPSKTDQRPWQDAENCPWDIFIWFDMSSYRKHWYLSFCSAHWLCFELTRATKYLLLPSFHLATQVILSTRKQYCRTLSK